MDYEFPVVFVDSQAAVEKVGAKLKETETGFSSEDIERTIFFVVNKTQRGISPSLKDALLYRIKTSGIQGLPIIEKEGWRINAAEIGITLNAQENSPLKNKINIGGKRETGKPIQLNSFVSSLEMLFKNKDFSSLRKDDKLCFLEAYWSSLRGLLPEAFDVRTEKGYMLLKALGVYSIHWLARDIFQLTVKQGFDFKQVEVLKEKLTPIKSFDWGVKTSPLSALGGMKGASKAHDLLLSTLNCDKDTVLDKQTLQNYVD
jgi:hypothetical protein